MDVTVISTVYEEGDQLAAMLDSLLDQTRQPDEIVIVDGGSGDGTWDLLQEYAADHDHIRAIQRTCNIAEGRNIAVREASNDVILGIDGGCIAEPDWVERMAERFEDGADAVAGMFRPTASDLFERVQGAVVTSSYSPAALERGDRAPSSRSIGFTREVWEAVGGYPEDLYTGEDTRFNAEVRAAGYAFTPAPDAVVRWQMRPTVRALWDQYTQYGVGDARAGNTSDHPSTFHGVSKNLLLLTADLLALLGLVLALSDPRALVLAAAGISAPFAYHLPQLGGVVRDHGPLAAPVWVLVVLVKTWGYFYGFMKEQLITALPSG